MATSYESHFKTQRDLEPALRRFLKAKQLAHDAEFAGLIVIDTIPWHSHSLPKKNELPRLIEQCLLTKNYCNRLRSYLADKSVLSIDGMSRDAKSPWLLFKARIMDSDLSQSQFIEIKTTNGRVTCGAYAFKNGPAVKVQYLTQGTNNFARSRWIEGPSRVAQLVLFSFIAEFLN